MAQITIKDYFSSKKIQDRGKNASIKRPLELFTVPRRKRRRITNEKVLTTLTGSQRADKFRDKGQDNSLCDIRTSFSSISSTPTTDCNETAGPTREAGPAGVKSCSDKPNRSETSLSTVSPLRRGAECVRLALEKKTSSPVTLGKDEKIKSSRLTETRRKLFLSEEVNVEPGTKPECNSDSEEISLNKPIVTETKSGDNISPPPVKQAIRGVSPLKKKASDTTKISKTPKLKHFTSLQYESPTKTDK